MRPTTDLEKEVFAYLNNLRESGETNMFGAAPYVADEFYMELSEARKYTSLWMKNFNANGVYNTIQD